MPQEWLEAYQAPSPCPLPRNLWERVQNPPHLARDCGPVRSRKLGQVAEYRRDHFPTSPATADVSAVASWERSRRDLRSKSRGG